MSKSVICRRPLRVLKTKLTKMLINKMTSDLNIVINMCLSEYKEFFLKSKFLVDTLHDMTLYSMYRASEIILEHLYFNAKTKPAPGPCLENTKLKGNYV